MNLRLFLAIKPPDEIVEYLATFMENLDTHYWKPAKTQQLHITLAFMGQTPEDAIDKIVEVSEKAAEIIEPFEIELKNCDVFPDLKNPRVLYAKAKSAQLLELGKNLRLALFEYVDQKSFKPHLTLGRVRKPGARKVIRKLGCKWPADGFSLYKSALNPSGAVHEQLKYFSFKKP